MPYSAQPTHQATVQEHIQRLFVFTMMWSLGCFMELADRAKIEQYMRANYRDLDLPPQVGADDSMFDYRVDENGTCLNKSQSTVKSIKLVSIQLLL